MDAYVNRCPFECLTGIWFFSVRLRLFAIPQKVVTAIFTNQWNERFPFLCLTKFTLKVEKEINWKKGAP